MLRKFIRRNNKDYCGEERIKIVQASKALKDYSDTYRNNLIMSEGLDVLNTTKTRYVAIPALLFYQHMSILSSKHFDKVRDVCKNGGYSLRWRNKDDADHMLYISLNMNLTEQERLLIQYQLHQLQMNNQPV